MTDPHDDLHVVRTTEADRLVLVFHGELDLDTLPTAQHELATAEAEAPPVLVIDLGELAYVDSSGVRLVLVAQHDAEQASRRLAVRLGRGSVRRMFDVLGLTGRLDVLDPDDGEPHPA